MERYDPSLDFKMDPNLKQACALLREYIENKTKYLEEIQETRLSPDNQLPRGHVENTTNEAAVQALRQHLSYLKGQLNYFNGPIASNIII